MFQEFEPFYGWLNLYNHEADERSPFHDIEHNQFYYDRFVYTYPAHPLWDDIGSESLLVKILFADYSRGFAVIELFGEWNDLFYNDFKLLCEYCLTYLADEGINKFILICENVFHLYLEGDDYYEAMQEQLEDGWICLLKPRDEIMEEIRNYGVDQYLFWSPSLERLNWRKMKPWDLFKVVDEQISRYLPSVE